VHDDQPALFQQAVSDFLDRGLFHAGKGAP